MQIDKKALYNLDFNEIQTIFEELNEPKYRADQLYNALYINRINSIDEITNFSKELREKISSSYFLHNVNIHRISSSKDGSKKFLFKLFDSKYIEAVYMPWLTDDDTLERSTLCISSMAGCPVGCKFCATGTLGLIRNITPSEILAQILLVEKELNLKLNNIVIMGMGEPLLNYENIRKALEIITDPKTEMISRRRITLSTSGIAPRIKQLAKEIRPVKLAISLHATTDKSRQTIMPIAEAYRLSKLMDAVEYYYKTTKMAITYEYIPLLGINDSDDDAKRLAKIAKRVPSRINLIPFNDISFTQPQGISKELKPTPKDRVYEFADKIRQYGATVIVRDTFGDDIEAACGQLALSEK